VNIAKNIAASRTDTSGVACRASVVILVSTRVSDRAKLPIGGLFMADVNTPTNRQDHTSLPSAAAAPTLSSEAVLDALTLISRAFVMRKTTPLVSGDLRAAYELQFDTLSTREHGVRRVS
jgi:hypothetical protein